MKTIAVGAGCRKERVEELVAERLLKHHYRQKLFQCSRVVSFRVSRDSVTIQLFTIAAHHVRQDAANGSDCFFNVHLPLARRHVYPDAASCTLMEVNLISREELYELVWSSPMTQAAEKFKVSGSYMARVCSALNVPRPNGAIGRNLPSTRLQCARHCRSRDRGTS